MIDVSKTQESNVLKYTHAIRYDQSGTAAEFLATYRDWSVSRLSKASGNSVKFVLRNTLKVDESG